MSHYYGYSDEATLALTEGAKPQAQVAEQSVTGSHPIDAKYAAMNLSPYLPGLARILQ